MRLVTVPEPPDFIATCLACGRKIAMNRGTDMQGNRYVNARSEIVNGKHETTVYDGKVADLDGEPFNAYYHWRCAQGLGYPIEVCDQHNGKYVLTNRFWVNNKYYATYEEAWAKSKMRHLAGKE